MTHRQEQILPFSFGTTIKENQNTRGRTMGLQNIFDMVKAERYTQDGREEIIKAQKETEDARRTYKNGEISEKTGLMKTPNGWVEPPANKGAESGKGAEKSDKWQKNTDYLGRERISMKTPQGGAVSIYENPTRKNGRFRVDTGSHYNEFNTMEEAKAFAEKHYGESDNNKAERSKEFSDTENHAAKLIERKKADAKAKREAALKQERAEGEARARDFQKKVESGEIVYNKETGKFEDNPKAKESDNNKTVREAVHEMNMKSKEAAANRAYERRQKEHDPDYKPEGKKALKLPDEKSSFQTDVNRMKKLKQQDYKQYTIQLEKLHSKYPINKWTALYDKTTRDSAPLTGDCKIRVRKS